MKGMLIGCTWILALLIWVTLSSPVAPYDPCAVEPPVITAPAPVYAYGLDIWAEWIRLPCRRRSYRNPLRRYRLTKKQRRRLQQQLRRVLERQTRPLPGQESPIPPEAGRLDTVRCA